MAKSYRYFTSSELSKFAGRQLTFLGWGDQPQAGLLVHHGGYYWLGNYKATTVKIKDTPRQIEHGEWLYCGCFIQLQDHPKLPYRYSVFKNDLRQTHVGVCNTFRKAKELCEGNPCGVHWLEF